MKKLHEEGQGIGAIHKLLGRSKDTVSKHVFKKNIKKAKKPKGRPAAFVRTPKGYALMEKTYAKMLREGRGKTDISPQHIRDRMGLDCAPKTISRAFWDHGVHLRPLCEKPDLDSDDRKARREWAVAHGHRSASQWNRYVHAIIDNKVFQVYTQGKHRDMAARRGVRGAYRRRRRVFSIGYVKPKDPKALKQNTGAQSVMVTCALGAKKVLMWHVVQGRWNATAAANMYSGPLRRALEKAHPQVRGPWRVLEDNDPTGYKSGAGMKAKAEVGIQTLDLPKRSPDMNPLDFSFWAELNKRMRAQERSWPDAKRETREQFLGRLRRTAMKMPSEYISKIVGALKGRCQQVLDAKGGHFPEGGF